MDKAEVLVRILAEVSQGEPVFPTSTKVALRVRAALDDPDCSIKEVVRLIKAEPMIAARVVAMVNSAAFNPSGREITDVAAAVNRLGFKVVQTAATAVATRQLAAAESKSENKLSETLWVHTSHVAALAHVIAKRVTGIDPETAMFAGIVHEVAGFYLLSRSHDHPELLEMDLARWLSNDDKEVDGEDAETDSNEAIIGRAVLRSLSIPSSVTEGIESMWQGYLGIPPATLGDTLLLANQLAPVRSPLDSLQADEASHIDMAVGEETLKEILDESSEQVKSLFKALQY